MNLELIASDGVFCSADAARVGVDRHALSRLCSAGQLLRLTRGWFAMASDSGHTDEDLHRLTSLALGRQFRSRAVVSHHSLLVVSNLPTYAADLSTGHLTSAVDDTVAGPAGPVRRSVTVRRPGLTIHRSIPGIRLRVRAVQDRRPAAMPLAHAIVQAGLIGGPECALVPADAALRQGLTTPDALAKAVADVRNRTGIGPVRTAIPYADGRHESPGETRTAYLLRALGFEFEPQHVVAVEGNSYRADFRITGTRVLVEFDGAVKYTNGERDTLFREKRREDSLRRAGWIIVRLVWSDLHRPDVVRRRLLAAVRSAS